MRRPVAAAIVGFLVATLSCSQPQPAPPATVVVPPEAFSDLATAVSIVSTQSVLIREAIATMDVTATTTPTPTDEDASLETGDPARVSSASTPPFALAMRLPASTAADAAPCAIQQIKGNVNSMIYHMPGGGSYSRTKANVVCFDTEAEAGVAGYRKARN